jgi:alpha,alpha-trehalose phosphorylase (configuration-retaining)
MPNTKVALQLSTRESFEVKVSEALRKGILVVATKAGGIPLQIEHGKSGYLIEPGDSICMTCSRTRSCMIGCLNMLLRM